LLIFETLSLIRRTSTLTFSVIIAANGDSVADVESVMSTLDDAQTGDTVRMTVVRDRRTMDLSLKLEKR
jgi:S1-C subfamily serine protease